MADAFGLSQLFNYPRRRDTCFGWVTDEEYEQRVAQSRAKWQARADCPLCDETGYRRGWLCNHRPYGAREEALVRETEKASRARRLTVVRGAFPQTLLPTDPAGWRGAQAENGGWYVYTMHTKDVAKHPVYVGFTGNVHKRMTQHRRHKAWWPLVHTIVVDCYPTKEEALAAEEQRIRETKPLFNVVSNQHTSAPVGGDA